MTSPKQISFQRQRDWYPYYAGYTEEFVDQVLKVHLLDEESILDPWNGSGTTTTVAARLGRKAAGVDINPALTVIARGRLAPRTIADSLIPLGTKIIETAQQSSRLDVDGDPLETWIRPKAARRLRQIQDAIHRVLSHMPPADGKSVAPLVDALPVLACFYYTALFAVARDVVAPFRATNPTWVKKPPALANRVGPSWETISARFVSAVGDFSSKLSIDDSTAGISTVVTGSATDLPLESGGFAGAVTSPPYATRIDYVKNSLPELAILGFRPHEVAALRKRTTGSPVVRGLEMKETPLISRYGNSVLRKIGSHDSKGSKAYYLPWMANYLNGLQQGLKETVRVVRTGPICIVVQDSHYKELRVDLQRVVIESMTAMGRQLSSRDDFDAPNLRARMNPRAARHLTDRRNSESLLVFR